MLNVSTLISVQAIIMSVHTHVHVYNYNIYTCTCIYAIYLQQNYIYCKCYQIDVVYSYKHCEQAR